MKAYEESGGIDPPFLATALDGGEWSASRPGHFTLGERAPGTHWIRNLCGSLNLSGRCGKVKVIPVLRH
jgi:hypothetical protein